MVLQTSVKKYFFDRQKVLRAVERGKAKAMSKQLAFIRTTARTKVLRRRKKVSKAGQPPSVHSQNPNASLKTIWFAYNPNAGADGGGVVGPVKLNQVQYADDGNRAPLPSILEGGGRYSYNQIRFPKRTGGYTRWQRRDGRRRIPRGAQTRKRSVNMRARPFMSVALQREVDSGNIMTPWANVVTG